MTVPSPSPRLRGEPVWAPRDYAAFAREGFMQNAIVYRSVRMIAEAVASIPLLLYEGANEIEQHPLLDLLRRPSMDHTGTDFLEAWYGFHVYFHLDPLWSSSNIDAIGIDVYWPLADWRDGRDHLDALAGATSIYDPAYLKANVQGGEGYDWYYASDANRDAQVRTPVTDGQGKPWVFRYKDILSWWTSQHYDRPGGIESATPTAWVPQSKPFWFMEIGCPAFDKGANQAERIRRPEKLGIDAALLLARHSR